MIILYMRLDMDLSHAGERIKSLIFDYLMTAEINM